MKHKKLIWFNFVASKLTVKDKTFGYLLSYKSGPKKKGKFIFNEKIFKKRKNNNVNPKKILRNKPKIILERGSILILLTKKYLGRKAILLNTTESGLFVISGPYLINGISIRRVNEKYTLYSGAKVNLECKNLTSTRINFIHASFSLNDEYFVALKKSMNKNFKIQDYSCVLSHKIRQNNIDRFLIYLLKKNIFFLGYLRTRGTFFTPGSLLSIK
jgi:ribosomal protein L14E/L6E/L27E